MKEFTTKHGTSEKCDVKFCNEMKEFTNEMKEFTSYIINPTKENKYINYLMIFSKGRYDITTEKLKTISLPKLIQKLLYDSLYCCDYKINIGFIPIFPNTKEKGPYHRDTKALFSWNIKDTNKADQKDINHIPDYYYTLLINLNDEDEDEDEDEDKNKQNNISIEEKGNTEFIIGSHKKSILDSSHLPISINKKYKAGDCYLFNGKIIHRGLANLSKNRIRHALYITFTAKWYDDT
jgi:hypothetical protein